MQCLGLKFEVPLQVILFYNQVNYFSPTISFCADDKDMEGDRLKCIEEDRDKYTEGDRKEDKQDGVLSDTVVPVETLNTYIRQHATDSHFQSEFSVRLKKKNLRLHKFLMADYFFHYNDLSTETL